MSLVAVAAAVAALVRDGQISPNSRHGVIGPPHVLGVITLAAFAVAAAASKTGVFGRFSAYVQTVSYSATVFFLSISTVTETLTRHHESHRCLQAPRYRLGAASATDFIRANPFSKSPPTILSMFTTRWTAFAMKLFLPTMLHVTTV